MSDHVQRTRDEDEQENEQEDEQMTVQATKMIDDGKRYIPNMSDPDNVPYVGQTFEVAEEAYLLYKKYAQQGGFNVRKNSNKLSENGTSYRWMEVTCSREGVTNTRWQEKEKHQKPRSGVRKRGRSRCGCMARINVRRQRDGSGWVVSDFAVGHNHPLTSPGKVHFLKCNRKVTSAQKNLVSQFSPDNIPTCQQFRFMGIETGGPSSVGCLERDIRNVERDIRQEYMGHDAETLVKIFEREKKADENFFYSLTTVHGVFERCFWVDFSSRSAYAYFGDVVVFDTTYNTNRYGMIFAPFVGVNNHMQTVLFGCGFLSNENNRKCSHCRQPGHTIKKCPQMQTRTGLVDEEYHPDMSFTTGNDGGVPDIFVSEGANNYSVYQTMLQGDSFLSNV